jgi:predicted ATP-dependent protease
MPDFREHASALAVPAARLRRGCEPLIAAARADQEKSHELIYLGQERAVESLRFGIQMEREGYNVFVLGPVGSNRHELVLGLTKARASEKGAPDDWCYVNSFSNPERPRALRLPPGQAPEFRDKMHSLIEEIRLAIPAVFEDDDYRNQRKALEAETQKEVKEQLRRIEEQAKKEGIAVLQTPTGYVLAPLHDGKVLDDKEFEKLPSKKQESIHAAIERLSEELEARVESLPRLRKRHHERIRDLDREVTSHTVSVLLEELKADYRDLPDVVSYLDDVEQDIVANAKDFRQEDGATLPFLRQDSSAVLASYAVNLVVSNEFGKPAPVVYEPNPSYPNLIGKIEHRAEMGALLTDFRMVRVGALQQANGGYLILDIHRILGRPFVWEALKQALFARQVRIESPADALGFVSTTTLKPEPIPLDVKVVLIGERWLYYVLSNYDKEFSSLFKVAADFDDVLARSDDNVQAFAWLVSDRIRLCELLPFGADAVARVIEQRVRGAEDSERLSMNIRSLDDLLTQADYWARQRGASSVSVDDVIQAIKRHDHRLSRVEERVVDAIQRQTILIDTSGSCVGQVNGLAVVDLGEYRFGHPVRITATTRIGTGDVVDIEREVELGGAIHSKGMMILSAALSARYAPEIPLSLHGSVVFEQSYGGVEGDSASVAELCALLSSISGVPVRQSIACTGSVNQLGRVQAVGGVNDKIEGFYEVCRQRGFDGSQGVVIPRDNVKHLMLAEEIVDSVEKGEFSIFAAQHIDEAIEILTGENAGDRGSDDQFPEGSVNRKVEDQLIRYARKRKTFLEATDGEKQHK